MSGGRVLIVDDSLTVRMDLEEAFEGAGYQVTGCATLAEARRLLASGGCQLLVLDVVLPDGDGVELLAEVRASEVTRALPVILLSHEAEVRDRLRGLSSGANEYVGKPYDAAHVLARVRRLLEPEAEERGTVVLVIDDSPTFRHILAEALEGAGYLAELAADGEEGLRRAGEVRPAAVIVDGVMPLLDGPGVIRRLRLDPGLRSTPCLLLTASAEASSEVAALDAGADAYVRKEAGTELILARLLALLRAAEETTRRGPGQSLLEPQRVMAVDDSATFLGELAEHLREEGYEAVLARSGEEALALLPVQTVDCILLDLVMPGLSGTQVCREIKSSPVLRPIPLILMTAHDGPGSMLAGIDAGADDYIAKGADFEVLKARLRAQLRRRRFEEEHRRVHEELLRQEAEARAARAHADAKAELLAKVEQQNLLLAAHARELEALNDELRTFAYSVSHDLRAPLRAMDGFSQAVLERSGPQLDPQGRSYLERIRAGAMRMNSMVDGLLILSRVTRQDLTRVPVDLEALARRILTALAEAEPGRQVEVVVQPAVATRGDKDLLECLLQNLLGNAWKFTAGRTPGRIEFGSRQEAEGTVYHVRDDGAGFDMRYAEKLFTPFQRLHSDKEFPGTGIGLATVRRIVHRHGGRVWVEAAPGAGATFRFTLAPGPEEVS